MPKSVVPAGGSSSGTDLTDAKLAGEIVGLRLVPEWKHCRKRGGWLHYADGYWTADEISEADVQEIVRQYVIELFDKAVAAGITGDDLKEYAKLKSAGRIAAITRLTRAQLNIKAKSKEFDADPELLGCGNGVVNLRTGELMPHSPEFMISRHTAVDYVPGATHPDWDRALLAMADPDVENFLQHVFGAGATGYRLHEDHVLFLHGDGANGKTTIVGAIHAALGDYSALLMASVIGGAGSTHETKFMALRGARLAHLDETPSGRTVDVAAIKRITGSTEGTGRGMRQDQSTFPFTHVLVIMTNHIPIIVNADYGTWRRLKLVPFPHIFRGASVDPGLRDRLHSEEDQQQAVLAWLVDGAQKWLTAGRVLPTVPEAIEEASERWRSEDDGIARFVSTWLEVAPDPDDYVEMAELNRVFNEFVTKAEQLTVQRFSTAFSEHPSVRALGAVKGKLTGAHRGRSAMFGLRFKSPV